jgi:electron transport complex protein RnfG
MTDPEAPSMPAAAPDAPAWRLTTTLAVAGALAGLMIVVVYQWAEPRIEAYRAHVLQEAIREVLHDPAAVDTLYVHSGSLESEPPAALDPRQVDRIYVGFDEAGARVGYAIPAERPGFQDVVRLIFGYDAARGEVIGMRVLESKETPGLGDKIIKDSLFVAEFDGVAAPLVGVKAGSGAGDPGEVDMITGATISSRTVIAAIEDRLAVLRPLIEAHEREAAR